MVRISAVFGERIVFGEDFFLEVDIFDTRKFSLKFLVRYLINNNYWNKLVEFLKINEIRIRVKNVLIE